MNGPIPARRMAAWLALPALLLAGCELAELQTVGDGKHLRFIAPRRFAC